jgi:hypothetical protein
MAGAERCQPDYVLNSDLNNARYITNDKYNADYDYGVVAINSDGHLAVNGDVAGNYKVRIDDARPRRFRR